MELPPLSDMRLLSEAESSGLLHLTARKQFLIRTFERAIRVILRLLPSSLVSTRFGSTAAKILVMEYWNLGDLVILMPFLRNLREKFPTAHICLLVKPSLARFLDGQGLVDEFISFHVPWAQHFNRWRKYNPFSLNWLRLIKTLVELRRRRFDCVFSGRMDIRDNFMMWLIGCRQRIGYGIAGGGFLLTNEVVPDTGRPHRAQLWLQLLQHLNLEVCDERGAFRLDSGDAQFAFEFLYQKGIAENDLIVGIHPGARVATRRWGDDNFAAVAGRIQSKYGVKVLWFIDPAECDKYSPPSGSVPVALPFRKFMGVLARCRILLCNDSGPMHLANLLGIPVVAVFGPTKPEWFGPCGPKDRVVIRPEFGCRPCFDYCIYDQPYCLRSISHEEVTQAAFALLEELQNTICARSY